MLYYYYYYCKYYYCCCCYCVSAIVIVIIVSLNYLFEFPSFRNNFIHYPSDVQKKGLGGGSGGWGGMGFRINTAITEGKGAVATAPSQMYHGESKGLFVLKLRTRHIGYK